jgi:SAM-dependent methyltransferase
MQSTDTTIQGSGEQDVEALPTLDCRADLSYLDFVEGFRAFVLDDPSYQRSAEQALDHLESINGIRPSRLEEFKSTLDELPAVQMHNRLMRTQQEMKWHKLAPSLGARRAELEKELADFDDRGPGRLLLDPDFEPPGYVNVHFHLQPGTYYKDTLSGFMYHWGTKVFFRGDDDRDALHDKLVDLVPPPADGRVSRILDLACSVGQSTTGLKRRFPTADVWGIDHSAPMLRVAHRRAVLLKSDVTFAQRLAEQTGLPDNHIDMAFAFILFHELPIRIVEATVKEMARVLRPGGMFHVFDFLDSASMSPLELYHRDFDARNNGEAYSQDFCDCDFHGLLEANGFSVKHMGTGGGYVKTYFAEKN